MSTEKKLTAVELLVKDLQKIQDGDLEIFSFSNVKKYLEEKYLPLEKQQIKNKCVEFSKYIRNGKDHFNNGYSTEMVYDEFIKN